MLALILFAGMSGFAQFEGGKQTYSSPNLKEEINKQKLVAILPLKQR
ncbi:MAG TPA: hypothetical protein VGP55_11830 [Chitinophagaceae bacterium]|nr:hypothetical protein [Chitinophagaceae bacterium]